VTGWGWVGCGPACCRCHCNCDDSVEWRTNQESMIANMSDEELDEIGRRSREILAFGGPVDDGRCWPDD